MKKGKFEQASVRSLSIKTVCLILTLVLLAGGVVGGTVAWLVTQSDEVVNTFTYGDINIDLEETDTELDDDDNPDTNDYEMIPGSKITKDPIVTVLADSEACWLFVKLVESENFDTFLTYEMEEGWTALDGESGVYYREVEEATEDIEFGVIKDNTVTVKSDVTKEMLNALDQDAENVTYPTLSITAYAVQKENIDTVEEAWTAANANPVTP